MGKGGDSQMYIERKQQQVSSRYYRYGQTGNEDQIQIQTKCCWFFILSDYTIRKSYLIRRLHEMKRCLNFILRKYINNNTL